MPTQLVGAIKAARASEVSGNPFASLRGRLILVTAVVVVTASLMAVGLLEDAAQRHRASAEEQLSETARALSLAVDERVIQGQAVLQTLAASPALQLGDLASFEAQARGSLAGPDSWIVLYDAGGKALVDTGVARGVFPPLARPIGLAQRWTEVLKNGDSVGGLVPGRAGRGFVLHLDHLIRVGAKPTYNLSMVLRPTILQRLIERQRLPAGWHGGILDGGGVTIARNTDPERWIGKPATQDMIQRLRIAPSGVFESVARDGVRTLAAYERSPTSGWTVAVALPRYEAAGDIGHSLQWLSIICATLLALGAGLNLWFFGSVARAIHSLESFAESLGRDGVKSPAKTGFSETDFIAQALAAAAERLKAREDDLQKINETLEARVEEATARLVQSQKIEAIGRLTGGIAHDFNNLLTAVIGNLDLLRRKLSDERLLQFVENARSAAERGAKLTAQLLAFARKQRLTCEPIDVNDLIGGMGELLASTLTNGASIVTHLASDLPPALADRTQLEMVLLNLVINARDALPDGGLVRIETGRERIEEPPRRPEHPPIGDYVRITVADTGIGMSSQVLERVFEPFFTTKPIGRGSGLGLPQAMGVVQQLGGGLRIESQAGAGAAIHVYLPAASETPRTAAPRLDT